VLVTAACSSGPGTSVTDSVGRPVATTPGAVPRPDHVLVVVFENKDYDQVIDNPDAPYLTSLARAGANLTNAHGERHPSQPNYVALLSGSTHGVRDDSCPQDLGPTATLASQLAASGHSFVGFSEALPTPGFTGCTSPDRRYARKHNPWVDFASTPSGANQPLSAMPADFAALPTVAVLIPDMCHDMHDCPVTDGDSWAREHLSGYVDWARTHNSLLLVTFDEDDGTDANHIPTVLVGPMVRPGDTQTRADHYTVLRTLEDAYGLPPLGAAASTPALTDIWTG
jgi:phosphatidylinositol-3-phosphatase